MRIDRDFQLQALPEGILRADWCARCADDGGACVGALCASGPDGCVSPPLLCEV